MAIGVDRGGPTEDMKVVEGQIRVGVEFGLEEVEETLWCEREREFGLKKVYQIIVIGCREGQGWQWRWRGQLEV